MQRVVASLLVIAFVTVLFPTASAEFGEESEDGWPIGADGTAQRPPVNPYPVTSLADDPHRHAHGHGLADDAAAPPLNKAGPVTLFPYYPILTAEVQRLALDHPDKVKLTSAGKSHAGLDMWLLEIANFADPDMIPLDQREVVYIDGGTHSNEYSGVYFVLELAQFLLDEYDTNETAKWIVDNRHTWILPMVNPDGSNVFGRLNAMLVNVNRNFPGSYGAVDESFPMNNPGPEPASEPETKTVIGLMDRLQPDYVNSIHCCGNLWLHPYGAEQLGDAPDLEMYTRICDEVFYDVRDDCGPIWSTIYPASGTTADEGYIRVGASSWTYEMSGRGAYAPWGQPAIMDDVRVQEVESWRGIIHALVNVHKYGAWPEVVSVQGDEDHLEVLVQNAGWGNLTEGTLRIGDHAVVLPHIPAEGTATVRVAGDFAAGDDTALDLRWAQRVWLAPQETKSFALTLSAEDGALVGILGDAPPAPVEEAVAAVDEAAPGPWIPAIVLGFLAVVLVARRR